MTIVKEYMIMPVIKGRMPGRDVDYLLEAHESLEKAIEWLSKSDEPNGIYSIDLYVDTEENIEECSKILQSCILLDEPDKEAIAKAVFNGPSLETKVIKRDSMVLRIYEKDNDWELEVDEDEELELVEDSEEETDR